MCVNNILILMHILLSKEFHQHSSNKNILKCAEVNYDLNIPKVPFSRYILNEIRKEGNNIAIV